MWGVGFDWITENLYVATVSGYIRACNTTKATGGLICATVLSGQGTVMGIALDPLHG